MIGQLLLKPGALRPARPGRRVVARYALGGREWHLLAQAVSAPVRILEAGRLQPLLSKGVDNNNVIYNYICTGEVLVRYW